MNDLWAVRLQPSGAVNTVGDEREAHKLAKKMTPCDGVTSGEVLHHEGHDGWVMRARYLPDQFDSEGRFIEDPVGRG